MSCVVVFHGGSAILGKYNSSQIGLLLTIRGASKDKISGTMCHLAGDVNRDLGNRIE